MDDLKKEVEAVLFSAGRAVSENEIASLVSDTEHKIPDAVNSLKNEYEDRGSPLLIVSEGEGWKLTVKEKYLQIVQRINPHTELSKAVMETLAVIAWKQPALQSEVIKIRTNKAYDHVKELESLGFISKEREGRSYKLKTTSKFLDYFDLPDPKAIKDMFKDFKDVELPKSLKDEIEGKVPVAEPEPDTLGKLEVYDEGVHTPAFAGDRDAGSAERLGDLDVYAEPGKETAQPEQAPEVQQDEVELPEEQSSAEDQERLKAKELAESLLEEPGEEKKEEAEEDSSIDPALEAFESKVTSEEKAEDEKMEAKVAPGEHPPEEAPKSSEPDASTQEASGETEEAAPAEDAAEAPAEQDASDKSDEDSSEFEEKPIVDVSGDAAKPQE